MTKVHNGTIASILPPVLHLNIILSYSAVNFQATLDVTKHNPQLEITRISSHYGTYSKTEGWIVYDSRQADIPYIKQFIEEVIQSNWEKIPNLWKKPLKNLFKREK